MKLLFSFITYLFIVQTTFADLSVVKESIRKSSLSTSYEKLSGSVVEVLKQNSHKKFFFIGEADHYFHEKYKYRLAFIKELVKNGYYNIYAEIGFEDGQKVNQFLSSGDLNYLKQVGLYGYRYGKELKFRDNAFVSEQIRFFKELRKLKKLYPKLSYAGFDLDMRPGTFYLRFDRFKSRPEVIRLSHSSKNLRKLLSSIEETKEKDSLKERIDSLYRSYDYGSKVNSTTKSKIKGYRDFLFSLKVFKSSLIFQYRVKNSKYSNLTLQWRENRMFEIMKRAFKREKKNSKYIFLGHNGHLLKNNKKNSEGKRYTPWDNLGAWITERSAHNVYAIMNFIGRGTHRGHGCPNAKTCQFEIMEGTLEEKLIELSPNDSLFFEQNKAISKYEHFIKTVVNGIEIMPGAYATMADAYFFIPEVTDLRK